MTPEISALLCSPFPKASIGKMPKGGTTLDYVGHAATTRRLLEVDPTWTWEPVALDERGLPAFDESGGLWIKLTIGAVTRLGYGAANGKKGPDAVKECIGDALRNAAMRFGVALDLWAKEDISSTMPPEPVSGDDIDDLLAQIAAAASSDALNAIGTGLKKRDLGPAAAAVREAYLTRLDALKQEGL